MAGHSRIARTLTQAQFDKAARDWPIQQGGNRRLVGGAWCAMPARFPTSARRSDWDGPSPGINGRLRRVRPEKSTSTKGPTLPFTKLVKRAQRRRMTGGCGPWYRF
jgi:hypothetical protein